MKKLFKKATSVFVAAVMAASMVVSAGADYTSVSWNVKYTNTPGNSSGAGNVSTTVRIVYSVYGARATVNSCSVTITGTTGSTFIYCLNYDMTRKTLAGSTGANAVCNPSIIRLTEGNPQYSFQGYTGTSGNTFTAGGNISMI